MTRTIQDVEKEINALIREGIKLSNEEGVVFNVLDETFYPGKMLKDMCDVESDGYAYIDDYYQDYPNGTWLSSSDFC